MKHPNDCGELQEVFITLVYYCGNLKLDFCVCLIEDRELKETQNLCGLFNNKDVDTPLWCGRTQVK